MQSVLNKPAPVTAGFSTYLALAASRWYFSKKGLIFLEIEVGGKKKNQLLAELQWNGFSVSDCAKDILLMSAWQPVAEKQVVKFARVKVRELGFVEKPTVTQTWARIRELGHSLCEPGDGPIIRLALKDQPRDDYFWIVMEQILDSGGVQRVFCLRRDDDGESWINTGWVRTGLRFDLDFEVVFRLGRQM